MNKEAPPPPDESVTPVRLGAGAGFLAVGVILLLAAFYVWSSHDLDRLRFNARSVDYYALQVHGWVKGSLAMEVEPHPDLRVEYPNKIVSEAPYLLDASYYQGRYYLYFGPVPALLFLLPYHLITWHDLPEAITAALFVTLGLALSTAWLCLLVTRLLGGSPRPLVFAQSVLGLGLANVAPATLVRPLFYEIAVGSSYAFMQGCLLATTLAVMRRRREILWLALASLAAGLAIGSRPNLIVGAAFLLPAFVLICWLRDRRTPQRMVRLLLAAGTPAALIVAGLLAYNHARFDRWLEFGNNLQLGANPGGFGFTIANFWHNLRLYYFTAPATDWFFPFFAPGAEPARPTGYFGVEEAHGQLVLVPAMLLALAIGIFAWARSRRPGPVLWIIVAVLASMAANLRWSPPAVCGPIVT